jgi:hypothetical protein
LAMATTFLLIKKKAIQIGQTKPTNTYLSFPKQLGKKETIHLHTLKNRDNLFNFKHIPLERYR